MAMMLRKATEWQRMGRKPTEEEFTTESSGVLPHPQSLPNSTTRRWNFRLNRKTSGTFVMPGSKQDFATTKKLPTTTTTARQRNMNRERKW